MPNDKCELKSETALSGMYTAPHGWLGLARLAQRSPAQPRGPLFRVSNSPRLGYVPKGLLLWFGWAWGVFFRGRFSIRVGLGFDVLPTFFRSLC